MSDQEAALKAALARAEEAETNMKLAAQYGQELIEKLSKSEKIQVELEQEKHSLKLQLQSKESNEQAMQDEINDLSSKMTEFENLAQTSKELQKSIEQERVEFSRKEQDMLEKIADMKEKLSEAEEQLSCNNIVISQPSPNVSLVDPAVVSDLREEIDAFKEQISLFKEENTRLKAENDEMNHLRHSLRLEISELKTSVEEKEDELVSYRESLRQANEEIKVLNLEVDDEEPIVDVAPKGNSLFSEVEDRRHIAEEKLKKVQTKLQEFKALYERKAIELNKLRMQNVHLVNMSASSNGAKYEQSHVDRLYTLLAAEKDKNKDLVARLSNETGDNSEFVKNLMKQSAVDGEMLKDFTKQCANLEKQMTKLKAQNFSLQMRLDEKLPAKKTSTSNVRKNEEYVVENLKFETKTDKKVEESKTKSEYKPLELKKQPLEDATNALKDKESSDNGEPKKKKVMFNVVETAATENEEDKPKKKVTRVPRESTREIIDADVECEKWNEQCKQQ